MNLLQWKKENPDDEFSNSYVAEIEIDGCLFEFDYWYSLDIDGRRFYTAGCYDIYGKGLAHGTISRAHGEGDYRFGLDKDGRPTYATESACKTWAEMLVRDIIEVSQGTDKYEA